MSTNYYISFGKSKVILDTKKNDLCNCNRIKTTRVTKEDGILYHIGKSVMVRSNNKLDIAFIFQYQMITDYEIKSSTDLIEFLSLDHGKSYSCRVIDEYEKEYTINEFLKLMTTFIQYPESEIDYDGNTSEKTWRDDQGNLFFKEDFC